jgi:hypothetical protein
MNTGHTIIVPRYTVKEGYEYWTFNYNCFKDIFCESIHRVSLVQFFRQRFHDQRRFKLSALDPSPWSASMSGW